VLGWLRGYDRGVLGADVLAGLTAAAVVLPKAMAYATVAGLAAQVGLYAALVPPIAYAALGRSPVLSVSTSTTIGILVGSALAAALPGADPAQLAVGAATLSVMVGLVLVAAAVLRFGFVANFISEPVLAGFKAGIGLVIVVDQVPKLLGVHIEKAGFFRDLAAIVRASRETSPATLAVSAAAIGTIVLLKRWVPRLPAALVAVAAGIAASALLGLPAAGVKTIGTIPAGLPALVVPEVGLLESLWPAALAVALMSFTETVASGRAFTREGQARPAPNAELVATGVANALGGLTGAMPAGGGTSQTLVALRAGARTQLAGLVVGLAALATALLLAPALSLMPQAVLASIVVIYSIELVSVRDFRAILAVRRTEFVWAVVAFAGVLLLGTLRGILVAVVTSVLALAHQASNPAVYEVARKRGTHAYRRRPAEHADDETWPGLLLVRVEGRIFFANTERVLDLVAPLVQARAPRVIVLDCSALFDLEYSALKMLSEVEARMRRRGAQLWLAALNPEVRAVVERSPLGKALGHDRTFLGLDDAVEHFQARGGAS
ncbi:MAG TPA: SulP family inorganic anion transporter, partial [Anaeromyxobacteraceae bacterium]|nr:SulP family inorganic anion transporter [Anaeromyxobacteraceae bacterium]